MNAMNDAEKIAQLEEILQTHDAGKSFVAISLAVSIEDEEDRNLHLLETVRWLLQNSHWQQSYGAAQLLSDSYEKSEALQAIAEYLATIGHLAKAFAVFEEAEKQSHSETLAAWQQAERLHHLAQSLRHIKAFFKADEIWESAVAIAQKGEDSPNKQDSLDAASVLADIAVYFARLERIEQAVSLAQQIKNISKRERTLLRISEAAQQIKQVA